MPREYDSYGGVVRLDWRRWRRADMGRVVIVLGYGVFNLGVVWWWVGGFLNWCGLFEGEVAFEEGRELVLGLICVCHFDGVYKSKKLADCFAKKK